MRRCRFILLGFRQLMLNVFDAFKDTHFRLLLDVDSRGTMLAVDSSRFRFSETNAVGSLPSKR